MAFILEDSTMFFLNVDLLIPHVFLWFSPLETWLETKRLAWSKAGCEFRVSGHHRGWMLDDWYWWTIGSELVIHDSLWLMGDGYGWQKNAKPVVLKIFYHQFPTSCNSEKPCRIKLWSPWTFGPLVCVIMILISITNSSRQSDVPSSEDEVGSKNSDDILLQDESYNPFSE